MFTKKHYQEEYNETKGIDVTNKMLNLAKNNEKNEKIKYPEFSKIQMRLFDSSGKDNVGNINSKFISGMKALLVVFDITNQNSFRSIKKYIEHSKLFFEKNNKVVNPEDDIIKQPQLFNEIPIIILGNKSDLGNQRQVPGAEVEELIRQMKKDINYTLLKYYEISVKNSIGIIEAFQDIIINYFNRKIDLTEVKKEEVVKKQNENVINENFSVIKEKKSKPSLDKTIFIYHQMLDKFKKQILTELKSLKEENLSHDSKSKDLEKKIESLTNNFNNENNALKEKLSIIENKNNSLEEQLKLKDKEIEELKQKVNDLILTTKDITLKFKISDENVKDEISINVKGETKLSEVVSMLYELCPYINNLNIKGFCLEGNENEKIDEMKTVYENKLVNGSLIVLIV